MIRASMLRFRTERPFSISSTEDHMSPSSQRIVRLTELPQGTEATVVKAKIDAKEEARLSELGLRRGAKVKILYGEKGQSVLLAVSDERIGVNWDVAQNIYVY